MRAVRIVNLPEPLYAKLRARATAHQRSVAEEAVSILQDVLGSPMRGRHSILELRGLGKEIWKGIDPAEYIRKERESWD